MDNRRYDLLLIDFDGTLCATRPAILHCLTAALAGATATPPAEAAVSGTIERGIGLEETFRQLAPEAIAREPDLLGRLMKSYRAMYDVEAERLTTLFPLWHRTLERVAAEGVQTAVVSNKGIAAVRTSLDRFGLTPFVALAIGDTAGVPKKPDPASFEQLVLPRFPSIHRHRTLVIGDTDADILFARHIGGHSCWARYGYGRAEICEALAPSYAIDGPEEIEAIVCS